LTKEYFYGFSTDFKFIDHALKWFSEKNELPEYIVHIRPTTPFRNPETIDKAKEFFIKHPKGT